MLDIIRKDPYIKQKNIASLTGFSIRKISMILASLKKKGVIARIGNTKGGHWEIVPGNAE